MSRRQPHDGQIHSRSTTGPAGRRGADAPVRAAYSSVPTSHSAARSTVFHPAGARTIPARHAAQRATSAPFARTTSTVSESRATVRPSAAAPPEATAPARARRAARIAARAAAVAVASTAPAAVSTTPYAARAAATVT